MYISYLITLMVASVQSRFLSKDSSAIWAILQNLIELQKNYLCTAPVPPVMPKLPECDKCIYYGHDYRIVCAIHPTGLEDGSCPDFSLAPKREDKGFEEFLKLLTPVERDEEADEDVWYPEGAKFLNGELVMNRDRSFYNGEEIVQPQKRWTREEMLNLLDYHPIFTNRCPSCEMPFPRFEKPPVHWDCSCGWKDDTI